MQPPTNDSSTGGQENKDFDSASSNIPSYEFSDETAISNGHRSPLRQQLRRSVSEVMSEDYYTDFSGGDPSNGLMNSASAIDMDVDINGNIHLIGKMDTERVQSGSYVICGQQFTNASAIGYFYCQMTNDGTYVSHTVFDFELTRVKVKDTFVYISGSQQVLGQLNPSAVLQIFEIGHQPDAKNGTSIFFRNAIVGTSIHDFVVLGEFVFVLGFKDTVVSRYKIVPLRVSLTNSTITPLPRSPLILDFDTSTTGHRPYIEGVNDTIFIAYKSTTGLLVKGYRAVTNDTASDGPERTLFEGTSFHSNCSNSYPTSFHLSQGPNQQLVFAYRENCDNQLYIRSFNIDSFTWDEAQYVDPTLNIYFYVDDPDRNMMISGVHWSGESSILTVAGHAFGQFQFHSDGIGKPSLRTYQFGYDSSDAFVLELTYPFSTGTELKPHVVRGARRIEGSVPVIRKYQES